MSVHRATHPAGALVVAQRRPPSLLWAHPVHERLQLLGWAFLSAHAVLCEGAAGQSAGVWLVHEHDVCGECLGWWEKWGLCGLGRAAVAAAEDDEDEPGFGGGGWEAVGGGESCRGPGLHAPASAPSLALAAGQ